MQGIYLIPTVVSWATPEVKRKYSIHIANSPEAEDDDDYERVPDESGFSTREITFQMWKFLPEQVASLYFVGDGDGNGSHGVIGSALAPALPDYARANIDQITSLSDIDHALTKGFMLTNLREDYPGPRDGFIKRMVRHGNDRLAKSRVARSQRLDPKRTVKDGECYRDAFGMLFTTATLNTPDGGPYHADRLRNP